ncbi:MAG: hypothetical protein JWQ35_2482 [Bacteriovoracaceae bacterium]|nr:hypothetical protein [Bacteriovoracaceae bacterium]
MITKYIFTLTIFSILTPAYSTGLPAAESLESLLKRASTRDKKIELYSSAEPAIAEFWKLAQANNRLALDHIKKVLAEMMGTTSTIDGESARQFLFRIVSTFHAGSDFYQEDVPNLSYHFEGYKVSDVIIDLIFNLSKSPSGRNLFRHPGSRQELDLEDGAPHPMASIATLVVPATSLTLPLNQALSPTYLRRQYKMADLIFMLINISFTDSNRDDYIVQLLQTTSFLAGVILNSEVKNRSPKNKKILKLRENLRINFSNWLDHAIHRSTFDPSFNDTLVRLSAIRSFFHLRNCELELQEVGANAKTAS